MVRNSSAGRVGGYTLAELMITLAIIGVVVMIGPQIFTQATRVWLLSRAKVDLQREARAAMYLITRELRQAQSNTIKIDQASGQPYYSRITFTRIQGTTETIAQNSDMIQLTIGTDVTTLTKNLEYMAFTFPKSDDMTIVSVSFTLQEEIYGGQYKALHMASEQVWVMN